MVFILASLAADAILVRSNPFLNLANLFSSIISSGNKFHRLIIRWLHSLSNHRHSSVVPHLIRVFLSLFQQPEVPANLFLQENNERNSLYTKFCMHRPWVTDIISVSFEFRACFFPSNLSGIAIKNFSLGFCPTAHASKIHSPKLSITYSFPKSVVCHLATLQPSHAFMCSYSTFPASWSSELTWMLHTGTFCTPGGQTASRVPLWSHCLSRESWWLLQRA